MVCRPRSREVGRLYFLNKIFYHLTWRITHSLYCENVLRESEDGNPNDEC